MIAAESELYKLYDGYDYYSENFSKQALELYNSFNKFQSAVKLAADINEFNRLTDDEKKELFDEFVDHYLGKVFIAEFLSNPLSLLKTVGLSLATGILLMHSMNVKIPI